MDSTTLSFSINDTLGRRFTGAASLRHDQPVASSTAELCKFCQVLDFRPIDVLHRLATSRNDRKSNVAAILLASAQISIPSRVKKKINKVSSATTKSLLGLTESNLLVYRHCADLQALQQSALVGCQLCRLLWHGLRETTPPGDIYNQQYRQQCDHSLGVALYLTAYRSPESHILLPLRDQHITAACGTDRFMKLDIIAAYGPNTEVSPFRGRGELFITGAFRWTQAMKKGNGSISLADIDLRRAAFSDPSNLRHRLDLQGFVDFEDIGYFMPSMPDVFAVPYEKQLPKPELNLHTGSAENMKYAAIWLNMCLKTHILCTCTTEPYTPLPRRLLDIGSNMTNPQCHLLELQNGQVGRYATLSHRWPKVSIIRTTTQNIHNHRRGIALSDCPQTFRDAVTVCRSLGIRYLWVDSLCIIQDSSEDWEREAAEMGNYYWNSFLNIAVAHAKENQEGCFKARDSQGIQPCQVKLRYSHDLEVVTTPVHVTPYIAKGYDWRFKEDSILDSRAWILQERVLAPRTLSFGENEMYFSCLTMSASEANPQGSRLSKGLETVTMVQEYQHTLRLEVSTRNARKSSMAPTSWRPSLLDDSISDDSRAQRFRAWANLQKASHSNPGYMEQIYNEWYGLVMEYNRRCITRDTDVLPAISGLAAYYHTILGDVYLAGLWAGDLIPGLLWSADFMTARPAQGSSAPSWTWASLRTDTICMWYLGRASEIQRCIQIHDAKTAIDGPNRFGSVIEGYIRLTGYLKPSLAIAPEEIPDSKGQKDREGGVRGPQPNPKIFRYIMLQQDEKKAPSLYDTKTGDRLAQFFPDYKFTEGSEMVWCLPVLQDRTDFGEEGVVCLVLKPSLTDHDCWRRVGFARIRDIQWFTDSELEELLII